MPLTTPNLITLGIESSCDETGIALYQTGRGLLAHALYTQVAMHNEYGGVVPELASRDHVRPYRPAGTASHARSRYIARPDQRDRIYPGAGTRRRIAGRRQRRQCTGLCARHPRHRHPSSGRPPAFSVVVRPRARIPFRCLAGLRRAHAADACRRRGAIHLAWRNSR